MFEFCKAAFPWVVMGICLALIFANQNKKKEGEKGKKSKEDDNTYVLEGLSLGLLFGSALQSTDFLSNGTGMGLGMLIGMAVGSCFKKKDKEEK